MKKRVVGMMSLLLVCTMVAASATGCGTKAEATDQELAEGDTIIVTENADTENDAISAEDEIAAQEVVTAAENAGAETVGGNIIFYTEWIGRLPDEPKTNFEFEEIHEEVTLEDDVIVKQSGGREVGYIKAGTTITLIEDGIKSKSYRVENASGVGYEYVYVSEDDLLTLDDMREFVAKHLDSAPRTVIDEPESDMEYIEFTIEKSKKSGVEDFICESLDNDEFSYMDHNVYCVECTKNGDLVDVRVYFK